MPALDCRKAAACYVRVRRRMYFQLLGPLEVSDQERSVAVGGGKRRSLLALLLLHANEVVPSERLIDELWGERPPATSGKIVRVYVSQLRRELRARRLLTRAGGYMLRVGPDDLDVLRFDGHWPRGRPLGRRASRRARPSSCAKRSRSGAGRRWPTSATSRSRSTRSRGSRSCGSSRSRTGSSRPRARAAYAARRRARRARSEIRCASACAAS